jgi:hypothetical protein
MDQIKSLVPSSSSTSATPRGRQTKFTSERISQIVDLVRQGKSREEIAGLIGVTVGTLQVRCSGFGISLRRPRSGTGPGYLQPSKDRSSNGTPAPEGDDTPSNGGLRAQSPLQPPSVVRATLHHARARRDEQDTLSFSLRMKYRGEERTTDIPITQDMMRQLAIEAWLRDMKIGEVVSEVIIGIFKGDLFHSVLDRTRS